MMLSTMTTDQRPHDHRPQSCNKGSFDTEETKYSCLPVERTRLQRNSRSNVISMMFVWFTLTSIVKKTASNVMDAAKIRLERNNFRRILFENTKKKEEEEAEEEGEEEGEEGEEKEEEEEEEELEKNDDELNNEKYEEKN